MSVGVASVPEIASPVDSLCVRLDGMLLELAEAVAGCVELRDVRGVTDRERIDRIARLEQLKAAVAALQAAESVRFAQSQVEQQLAAGGTREWSAAGSRIRSRWPARCRRPRARGSSGSPERCGSTCRQPSGCSPLDRSVRMSRR